MKERMKKKRSKLRRHLRSLMRYGDWMKRKMRKARILISVMTQTQWIKKQIESRWLIHWSME
jgi:hypothetical protein